jgi:phthiocerol/phenolphthiocerol synthesis type-I polyketide synthase E
MSDSDIAIIGLAGRFPKASSAVEFWNNLRDGVECISFFTEEELLAAGVPQSDLSRPDYVRARGILEGYDAFDHEFFGFSPREAELLNPQHRCFLECAWTALEDAGYDPERYSGAIGVFAGSSTNSYLLHALKRWGGTLDPFQITILNDKDFVPTHVSYRLNLRGPGYNVQTACSTSLVAVHVACQNLLSYQCDMALAGGVSIMLPQVTGYLFTPGGIQSPDGHCRAFDANAQGTVGGAGLGIVVLKRLADAVADGETIRAVIKGSAVNNDGAGKVGFTAPGVEGQAAVIAEALAVAGINPETISYVEAHGTGTSLGDPIEIAALSRAYRAHTQRRQFCGIGSVKSNIGHLDAAAGVAGLIKTVLALQHRLLPRSLHFERPNPQLDLSESPFYVVAESRKWGAADTPRRAGVSSFGIGGTNAHVILQEAPELPAAPSGREVHALLLSARNEEAVAAAAANLADELERPASADLPDIAWTLQQGRRHFASRRAVICSSKSEAVELLRGGGLQGMVTAGSPQVAFLLPGLGPQYPGMGTQLFRTQPFFRSLIESGCEALQPLRSEDLRAILWPKPGCEARAASLLAQPMFGMPLLFLHEYALAQLWMHLGVEPDALLGHSLGEYAAACIAGVFSWEDGLRLVAERGALFSSIPAGAMVRVALAASDVRPLLPPTLSIAAINGPQNTVVAGGETDVRAWLAKVMREFLNLESQELAVHAPGHCQLVEPLMDQFRVVLGKTSFRAPCLRYLSNLTGEWITATEATDPEYWLRHMRHTVQFDQSARRLFDDSSAPLFAVEPAPGRTLTSLLKLQPTAGRAVTHLPSLPHATEDSPDAPVFLTAAARLWLNGVDIKWDAWYDGESRRRVPLPGYPFQRQSFNLATGKLDAPKTQNSTRLHADDWFSAPIWMRSATLGEPTELPARQEWLVLPDCDGLAESLIAILEQRRQQVFRVDGDSRAGVSAILHRCRGTVRQVLDCRTFNRADESKAAAAHYQDLLAVAQACGGSVESPIRLTIVTNGLFDVIGTERLYPNKAALLGLCRVLPQEYPHIACRVIDVVAEEGSRHDLVQQIASELLAAEPIVALRKAYRWTPRYIRLSQAATRNTLLRRGGVYWITGGLGMIGTILARRLARNYQARLVLTTSSSPDHKSEVIRELEASGATVLALQTDASDRDQLARALVEAERRFGRIHGVIHAAGRLRPCTIAEEDPSVAAFHIAPKAEGLEHLAAVLQDRPLDFCLVMSSLSAVLGGLGLASYSASNAVADARIALLRRSGTPWISVNWDGWRSHDGIDGPRNMATETMSPEEGWSAFETALAYSGTHAQLVHSISDLHTRIAQWIEGRASERSTKNTIARKVSRSHIQTPYQAPENEIERTIADLWEQLLGVSPIGRRDNFFEAGGHSLLATRLIAILRETFRVDIPLRPMFLQPTVEAWAALVVQAMLASAHPDLLSRALDEAAAHG